MNYSFRLGSHNTMSYAKPKAWYLRPFHFIAKCQSLSYREQYLDYGVRLFDLRVKWNKKESKWEFAHGSLVFKTEPVENILSWLNDQRDCHVRLVLEYNKPVKDIGEISSRFTEFCEEVVENYRFIQFFEFARKYDWQKLFSYAHEPDVNYFQAVSSVTGTVLDDWFPGLYAATFNKNIIDQGTSYEWMLMDFIGKYGFKH